MKKAYATSTTLFRDLGDGRVNLQSALKIYEAESKEEAQGIALSKAREDYPDHAIFSVLAIPVFIEKTSKIP